MEHLDGNRCLNVQSFLQKATKVLIRLGDSLDTHPLDAIVMKLLINYDVLAKIDLWPRCAPLFLSFRSFYS